MPELCFLLSCHPWKFLEQIQRNDSFNHQNVDQGEVLAPPSNCGHSFYGTCNSLGSLYKVHRSDWMTNRGRQIPGARFSEKEVKRTKNNFD